MVNQFSTATSILRGYDADQACGVARVLVGSKVKNMEIALNTDGAFETIRALSEGFSDKLNIGAGTVLTLEQLKRAADAGACFVLAPSMMSQEMVDFCHENSILCIPGAYSPSEIRECFQRGADIVKVFPANELSKSYARKVCEPLGDLKLMAVGGVNEKTLPEYLAGGYAYVGSAGGIFKKADILAGNEDAMRASLKAFEAGL